MNLHPTNKKCRCGFIGNRTQFYNHMSNRQRLYKDPQHFFASHGEIPYYTNEAQPDLTAALTKSLERQAKLLTL
jgi:hypothetical protein